MSKETEEKDLRHLHSTMLENELAKLVELMDSPLAASLIEEAILLLKWARKYERLTWPEE